MEGNKNIDKNMKFMKKLWEHNDIPEYCHDISLFNKTNVFTQFKPLVELENKEGLDTLAEGISYSNNQGIDAIISCIPGISGSGLPSSSFSFVQFLLSSVGIFIVSWTYG